MDIKAQDTMWDSGVSQGFSLTCLQPFVDHASKGHCWVDLQQFKKDNILFEASSSSGVAQCGEFLWGPPVLPAGAPFSKKSAVGAKRKAWPVVAI